MIAAARLPLRSDPANNQFLSVVDQVEKGELSYKEAQERCGIQGKTIVLTWLSKHGRQDWIPGTYIGSPRMGSMPEKSQPLSPEQRIKELGEQLALVNQKAQFFEAVVDVLKNDYGLSVVKNRPGSSSRKNESKI